MAVSTKLNSRPRKNSSVSFMDRLRKVRDNSVKIGERYYCLIITDKKSHYPSQKDADLMKDHGVFVPNESVQFRYAHEEIRRVFEARLGIIRGSAMIHVVNWDLLTRLLQSHAPRRSWPWIELCQASKKIAAMSACDKIPVLIKGQTIRTGVWWGPFADNQSLNFDLVRIFLNQRIFIDDTRRVKEINPVYRQPLIEKLRKEMPELLRGFTLRWSYWPVDRSELARFRNSIAHRKQKTFTLDDFPPRIR